MSTVFTRFFRTFSWVLLLFFFFNFFAIVGIYRIQQDANRTFDASSLRYISQEIRSRTADNPALLENAKDVWDYARLIAKKDGVENDWEWISANERGYPQNARLGAIIEDQKISPSFLRASIGYTVALIRLDEKTSPDTPILWTRGLRSDGTWSANSPYGGRGGAIAFYSGAIYLIPNINSSETQLKRYDGKGTTSNIRDALPPGARISEYVPTPEDEASWLRTRLWQRYGGTAETRGPGFPMFWSPLMLCVFIMIVIPGRNLARLARTLILLPFLQALLMWATY